VSPFTASSSVNLPPSGSPDAGGAAGACAVGGFAAAFWVEGFASPALEGSGVSIAGRSSGSG